MIDSCGTVHYKQFIKVKMYILYEQSGVDINQK